VLSDEGGNTAARVDKLDDAHVGFRFQAKGPLLPSSKDFPQLGGRHHCRHSSSASFRRIPRWGLLATLRVGPGPMRSSA
jgi:hypothetical protein